MAVASTVAGVYCWDDRVAVKKFCKPKVCPIRILCTPKYFLNVLRALGEFKINYPNMGGTVSNRVSIIWQFRLNSFRPTQWPCYLLQRLHLQSPLLLTAIHPRPKSGPKKLWRTFKYSLRVGGCMAEVVLGSIMDETAIRAMHPQDAVAMIPHPPRMGPLAALPPPACVPGSCQ